MNRMRVLIVDDHALIRRGVRGYCDQTGLCEVVGEAENGRQALELAQSLIPDLILMDVRMPVMDGFEATRQIRRQHPQMTVLILTAAADDDSVQSAMRAGANGYLQKDQFTPTLLAHAIEVVRGGGLFFDRQSGTGWLRALAAADANA